MLIRRSHRTPGIKVENGFNNDGQLRAVSYLAAFPVDSFNGLDTCS